MTCTCGYTHGFDSKEVNGVRFISRYGRLGENDYCVNGRRVGFDDDGSWRHNPTYEEREAVREWERVFNPRYQHSI